MGNASHATRMQAPRSVTAFLAISLLRDGLTTFFERLRHDLRLELFLKVHLLQTTVLFFKLFHARHHEHVHTAALGSPFVKRRRADAQLTADIWNTDASLNAFDRVHDLAVTEFWPLHIEPLPLEKILLLTPLGLRDDYPADPLRDEKITLLAAQRPDGKLPFT